MNCFFKSKKENKTQFYQDSGGMTLVEVLVAFVILSIFMGLLSGIIAFSRNMIFQTMDIKTEQEAFAKEFYKEQGTEVSGVQFRLQGEDGTQIPLDRAKLFSVSMEEMEAYYFQYEKPNTP